MIDSGSVDDTAEVAAAAGASVYHRDAILPEYGTQPGKGEVLWKALAVATGDIICYVDADLTDFRHDVRHRPARAAADRSDRRPGQGVL